MNGKLISVSFPIFCITSSLCMSTCLHIFGQILKTNTHSKTQLPLFGHEKNQPDRM